MTVHSINPNGGHLTCCDSSITGKDARTAHVFVGLLVYGSRHKLCPGCVDGIEFTTTGLLDAFARLTGQSQGSVVEPIT